MKTAERQLKKMHRRTLALLALLVAIAFPAAAHNRTPLGDLSAVPSPAIAWSDPLGESTDVELELPLPIVDDTTLAAFDEAARIDIDLPADPLDELDAHLAAIISPAETELLPIVSGLENRCSGFPVSLIGPNVRQTNELSLKLHWGHDHVRNRWFDPNTGTWLTPDPLGYRDSSNLYAFAGGDPVNGRDPLGLGEGDQAFWAGMRLTASSPDYIKTQCIAGKLNPESDECLAAFYGQENVERVRLERQHLELARSRSIVLPLTILYFEGALTPADNGMELQKWTNEAMLPYADRVFAEANIKFQSKEYIVRGGPEHLPPRVVNGNVAFAPGTTVSTTEGPVAILDFFEAAQKKEVVIVVTGYIEGSVSRETGKTTGPLGRSYIINSPHTDTLAHELMHNFGLSDPVVTRWGIAKYEGAIRGQLQWMEWGGSLGNSNRDLFRNLATKKGCADQRCEWRFQPEAWK